jgi:uncharacterized protein (DUF1015 family)
MEIRPFKALRFDESVVGDVGSCISPPYDVIDADMQQRLYEKNPYNVVRIIRPKDGSVQDGEQDKYTRVGKFFNELIETGVLKSDKLESIYAYVQDFLVGDDNYQRAGFVALGKLAEFGEGVHPHEKTLDGPKADRLILMRANDAQLGQIFMLYDDPERIADKLITKAIEGSSLIDYTDEDEVRHRLFAIDKPEDIKDVAEMMADKNPVIADGHHRYETALNYYAETQKETAAYRMMTFVNMQNPGLVILPTHRLIANVAEFDIDKLIEMLRNSFEVSRYHFDDEEQKSAARENMFSCMQDNFGSQNSSFGIYAASGDFYVATLKDKNAMEKKRPELSQAARNLDVNVLHGLILDDMLGIGEKQLASQSNIEYIKDIGDAIDKSIAKVDSGKSQAVFFMNPTKIEQVKDVAAAGEKMPQKSTFFYPKVYTGLVINKL